MIEQAKAAQGGHPNAALKTHKTGVENYAQSAHGTQLRLPPYANRLRPRAGQSLFVVIGRRGWELFRPGTDYALLLPTPDTSQFRFPGLNGWPDALIVDVDNTLTAGEEREVARALLAAGCPYVVGRWSSYARRADA